MFILLPGADRVDVFLFISLSLSFQAEERMWTRALPFVSVFLCVVCGLSLMKKEKTTTLRAFADDLRPLRPVEHSLDTALFSLEHLELLEDEARRIVEKEKEEFLQRTGYDIFLLLPLVYSVSF